MKKSFMTRALAMGLSLAMAFSLSAATNVSVASAAATPAMASKQFAVRVGGASKSYKASTATQKSFRITKATVGNTDKATVSVNSSRKSLKVTPGTVTGTTVVTVTFKNIKTAKSTAKKYRCVVKAAIEPEKPVEPEVVKATKITEAKATTAKTASVTFDGVVDTSTATAIKLERGTTAITVTAKYADDKKSVLLTSDTAFAAGTYTVTVGDLAPVSFNVTKQTPTKLNITNSTIANQTAARVYFQVLDQYGEVMENYTDKKLTVSAYNVSKGHNIAKGTDTKKDYFTLNCDTQTVTGGGISFLNSIGDKISIVAYLTDNAAVSCTKELEIVRVYGSEITFGDIKLGDDKRVTVGREYEVEYTAKDNEGNEYKFDEQIKGANGTAATITIGNYHFISSNTSAVNMQKVSVDSNGRLKFLAEQLAGTAVITAINTITGEATPFTVVVNNTAKLSSMEIGDASVACDATPVATLGGTGAVTFKAAVTAYDQFGEMLNAKDIKNVRFANSATAYDDTYFSSITSTPKDKIVLSKITSDGKYAEFQVIGSLSTLKNQSVRFDFVSKEMGENGYIRSTAMISVDDKSEPSALEIVKKPDATVTETKSVSVQFVVKDQYQNKLGLVTDAAVVDKNSTEIWCKKILTPSGGYDTYSVDWDDTNNLVSAVTVKNGDDDNVYKMEFTTNAVANGNLKKTGTITVKLMDGLKVVGSETFDVTAVESIDRYVVTADKAKYKAGEAIKAEVDAYSNGKFNANYNDTVDVDIAVSNGAIEQTYEKTIKFVNGTATFDVPAATKAQNYRIKVTAKKEQPHCPSGLTNVAMKPTTTIPDDSTKFEVVENAAGKIAVSASDGKFVLQDSKGNSINLGAAVNTYATIKLVDTETGTDITGGRATNFGTLKSDNTIPAEILANGKVVTLGGVNYSLGTGLQITNVPLEYQGRKLTLSVTINDITWSKTVPATSNPIFTFQDGAAVDYVNARSLATSNASDVSSELASGSISGSISTGAIKVVSLGVTTASCASFTVVSQGTIKVTNSAIAASLSSITIADGSYNLSTTISGTAADYTAGMGFEVPVSIKFKGKATVGAGPETVTTDSYTTVIIYVKYIYNGGDSWTVSSGTTPNGTFV